MGDRGNIVVRAESNTNTEDVWLYSHWSGYELPKILKSALRRGKDRWDDAPYLGRIIFCEMVKDNWKETTSYGISARMGDNEHPILIVDTGQQKVFTISEKQIQEGRAPETLGTAGVPFNKFIA